MAKMDEFALIRLLTENRQSPGLQASHGVLTGIGDDAAVIAVKAGSRLVLSCDTLVQDIHFKPTTMKHSDIGYKAMAASISDIAAMGAVPRFALVSLTVPQDAEADRLKELYDGLYECADAYNVMVIGGNTAAAPHDLTINVSVIGEIASGEALLRSSAKPGDVVFITGFLGRSAAGLDILLSRRQDARELHDIPSLLRGLIHAHQRPAPQVESGLLLQQSGVCHALNDISDGLAGEAWEIAEASGCAVVLREDALPIAAVLRTYADTVDRDPLDWILYGGEDYELVGTVPASEADALRQAFEARGLHFSVIGETEDGLPGVRLIRMDGESMPVPKNSYNHFER